GTRITAARRHGKYLLLDRDGALSILVHLGMTGALRLHRKADPRARHTHVVLGLAQRELRLVAPRRVGQFDVVVRGEEKAHPALALLGPDALDQEIDVAAMLSRARDKRT